MNGCRFLFLLALLCTGCAVMQPSAIPFDQPYIVAVKDVQMDPEMPWVTHFAHHTWFEIKNGSERDWIIIEIVAEDTGLTYQPLGPQEARSNVRWTKPVTVLALITGEQAKAMIPPLEANAQAYPNPLDYTAWLGRNSNTFASTVTRKTPGLYFEFDHNAVGKDYTPWIHAGRSVTGTGFQIDTPVLGLELGLREGVEIHFIQLTAGISLFPPALKIPFLPRIGWPSR